ncbi:IclR family transcriptional regulator [Frigidibacter sp. MR17.24]|uniref:IclR family transcriptional regulator n=1 Tax=Frigidibacter sp. MR17.24 TaxID=3127345 RepID=UPI003012A3D4
MAAFQPVRAVVRALDVLSLVSEQGEITASAIARRLGLPQPTVVRILETLESCGYVYRCENGHGFAVSARTKTLSRGYDARSRLVQIARPEIDILHREVGWPSNLAVREGRSMTIAYSNRAAYGMSMSGRLGAQIPFLATGVGLAYLAHMREQDRAPLLGQLRASPSRWDSDPALWERLPERLEQVRASGMGFADETYLDEIYQSRIWAVALPILVHGEVEAAVSCLVLRNAGTPEEQLPKILPALAAAAGAIAAALERESDPRTASAPPPAQGGGDEGLVGPDDADDDAED